MDYYSFVNSKRMHRALLIHEILLNIFAHCHDFDSGLAEYLTPDLPAVARTCRAFKELALDLIWEELYNASPLAQCIPEVSHQPQLRYYSFSRSLTQTEWGVLRSYTSRVRSMRIHTRGLDWESVKTFLNPSTAEPLFPNLRHLYVGHSTEIKYLLDMPLPSLTSIGIEVLPNTEGLRTLQGSFESLSEFSPDIRSLIIWLNEPDITFSTLFCKCISRWNNLQIVSCDDIPFDINALAHLSHMPALTRLSCTVGALCPPSGPLFFTNLRNFSLRSEHLGSISWLLSRTCLPAMIEFIVFVYSRPSKRDVLAFFSSVQVSAVGHCIEDLYLHQGFPANDMSIRADPSPVLDSADLHPCTAFCNLRVFTVNIDLDVGLTDAGLLTLVSAWPHLNHLAINEDWGWRAARGGITPHGLVQLLYACQSLGWVALALDVRGYTTFQVSVESSAVAAAPRPGFSIDVLDAPLEAASVQAMADFWVSIMPQTVFFLRAGKGWFREEPVHVGRWNETYNRAYDGDGV